LSSRFDFSNLSLRQPTPGDFASILVACLKDWRRQDGLHVKNLGANVPKAVPMTGWN
jgi:hypothetical protein